MTRAALSDRRPAAKIWFRVWPTGEPGRAHFFSGADALEAVAKAHRFFGSMALEWKEVRS